MTASPIREYTFIYAPEGPEGEMARGGGGSNPLGDIAAKVEKFVRSICKKSTEDCGQYGLRVQRECTRAFPMAGIQCGDLGQLLGAECGANEASIPTCGN